VRRLAHARTIFHRGLLESVDCGGVQIFHLRDHLIGHTLVILSFAFDIAHHGAFKLAGDDVHIDGSCLAKPMTAMDGLIDLFKAIR
jgi:hypothetical protein